MSEGYNTYYVVVHLFFLLFVNTFKRVGTKSLCFFWCVFMFFLESAVSAASFVLALLFLVLIS